MLLSFPADGRTIDASACDVCVSYCVTNGLDEPAIQTALDYLSAEERARHDRLHFARDRRDYAAAHALLRRTLSAESRNHQPSEWAFTASEYGKPALTPSLMADTRLSFNISHTHGLVACVAGRDAVLGIDVESIERATDVLALAERFFSATEVDALQRCDVASRQARFIDIWTLKEAYIKAIGEGLSCPLHEFAFIFDGPSSLEFRTERQLPGSPWQFALFAPTDGHRMAIAIGGSGAPKRVRVCRDPLDAVPSLSPMPPLRSSVTLVE